MIPVGLRIDVDTFRGTRDGVPTLVDILDRHNIKATFFMSVGPDNMGRHLWRLLKPAFLFKMLRSNAASLYGWDILLRGTAWPGPIIGDHLHAQVLLPYSARHEVGLHAWDHYSWQTKIDRFSSADMYKHIRLGFDKLGNILGSAPTCSAAAGWRCNEVALLEKQRFGFRYNSDCRGASVFQPVVDGQALATQIPVTLPTYDEVVGRNGITAENYNEFLLQQIKPNQLNVYTIHAEVEGIACQQQFDDLLHRAKARQIAFKPLGALLDMPAQHCAMTKMSMPGREGWLAQQGEPLPWKA